MDISAECKFKFISYKIDVVKTNCSLVWLILGTYKPFVNKKVILLLKQKSGTNFYALV